MKHCLIFFLTIVFLLNRLGTMIMPRGRIHILISNYLLGDYTNTTKLKFLQISKFHYMFGFVEKQYPENFAFLILTVLELFTREVCIFLK